MEPTSWAPPEAPAPLGPPGEGRSGVAGTGEGIAPPRRDLRDLSLEEIAAWLAPEGIPPYRARQVWRWLHARRARTVEEMTDLPKDLRERMSRAFEIRPLTVERLEASRDGSRKFLFRLADGQRVESVLIPDPPFPHESDWVRPPRAGRVVPEKRRRWTVCLSSQVGCAMGCTFCLTGRVGWVRQLAPSEILGQLQEVERQAAPEGIRVTNVVFMGMGEPLHNYDAVVRSIRAMAGPEGMGYAARRITVSTVGLVPQIERLFRETRVSLSVSLVSAVEGTRGELMPVNRRWGVARLRETLRSLPLDRRRYVTFEVVLLAGVNDAPQDARELAAFVRGIPCKVNLIPFNEFPGAPYRRPSPESVETFRELLVRSRVFATVRESRGRDISAACGQLFAGYPSEEPPRQGAAAAALEGV